MLVLIDSENLETLLEKLSEKLAAALKTVHPMLQLAKLDTLGTDGSKEAMTDFFRNTVNTRFRVFSAPGKYVGVLEVIGDSMLHVVTEIFTTHAVLKDDGTFDAGHNCTELYTYFRSYNIDSPNLENAKGTWSPWRMMLSSERLKAEDLKASVDNALQY